MNTPDHDWKTLLEGLSEMSGFYPQDLVVIGGAAVYFLSKKNLHDDPEISHDVDFALSIEAYSELREIYETTKNRRLGKSQFIRKGLEYDVYVANQNNLVVPYETLIAHAIDINGVMVANPAHLLVLKLAAAQDRQSTSKGDKDVRDLIRIVEFLRPNDISLALPFLTQNDVDFMETIGKSRLKSFSEVAGQEMTKSTGLRRIFQEKMDAIRHETGFSKHTDQRPRFS